MSWIQVWKPEFNSSIYSKTWATGWFSLHLVLKTVGQGVSLGLHARILTERTNGCKYRHTEWKLFTHRNTVTLYPTRILIQHMQVFQVLAKMNLCAIASHQVSSPHRSLAICRARWVLLLDQNQLALYTQQVLEGTEAGAPFTRLAFASCEECTKEYKLQRYVRHSVVHLPVKIPVIAKIHPPWQKDKYLLYNTRLNNTRWSLYPQKRTFFSRFIKILHIPFVKPHWLNTRRKDQHILHTSVNIL